MTETPDRERLSERRSLALTPADCERVRVLAARLPVRRGVLLRIALRAGLELIEGDPTRLVRPRTITLENTK
jgi:hypothetical protein